MPTPVAAPTGAFGGEAGLAGAACLLPLAQPVDSHQWLTAVALKLSGHDRVYLRHGWERAAEPYLPPCAPERVRFDYLCT